MKEPKIWETKFGEKTSEIEIWDRNCRNEFTGGKLRERNCGSEIAVVRFKGGKMLDHRY